MRNDMSCQMLAGGAGMLAKGVRVVGITSMVRVCVCVCVLLCGSLVTLPCCCIDLCS